MDVVKKLERLVSLQEQYGFDSTEVRDFLCQEKDDVEFQRYTQMSHLMRIYATKTDALTFHQALVLTILNLVAVATFILILLTGLKNSLISE